MTFGEKLRALKEKFGLDDEHLSEILHITERRLTRLIEELSTPNEKELEYLYKTFNIEPKRWINENYTLPNMTMRTKIDVKKYKDIFNAYVETLKEYYPDPWEVYVIAKLRNKSSFDKFMELFKKPKQEVNPETSIFTPNYLAVLGDARLLINISEDTLEVTELPEISKEQRFTYGKYRYVRANKVQLKKYVPPVERYYGD